MGLKHQAASRRKWRAAIRQVRKHIPVHLPPTLFLTDPERTPDPISLLPALPRGTGVVYRHFGAADRRDTAALLQQQCRALGLHLIIAADPELALEVGADGVHWPESQLKRAPQWRNQFILQTASAHSYAAIRRADLAGMDAALMSTIFRSDSASAGAPLGPHRFSRLCLKAAIPLYALGGVNAQNAQSVASYGGIAAIDGFVSP